MMAPTPRSRQMQKKAAKGTVKGKAAEIAPLPALWGHRQRDFCERFDVRSRDRHEKTVTGQTRSAPCCSRKTASRRFFLRKGRNKSCSYLLGFLLGFRRDFCSAILEAMLKRFISAFCAGSLGLAVAVSGMGVSFAAPVVPAPTHASSDVQTIQSRERVIRRAQRSERQRPGYRVDRHRPGYWKGHRGYRHQRPGYRRHSDGFWYPLAAFGIGAAIGGAIANQPQRGNAHVEWCYNRYRSYRASDNTFQPYNGPRRQCVSPY